MMIIKLITFDEQQQRQREKNSESKSDLSFTRPSFGVTGLIPGRALG